MWRRNLRVPAANRVLASMHRNGRFPHSLTFRVDDLPPAGSTVLGPVAVGSVNTFGDATVDQTRIGKPVPLSGPAAATNFGYSVLDPVVNANLLGGVLGPVRVVPSNLQGSAQLQLSPPALAVNDRSGTNVTVELDIRSRYFPDPGTAPLAEFIHGQLQITAAVNQVTSQCGQRPGYRRARRHARHQLHSVLLEPVFERRRYRRGEPGDPQRAEDELAPVQYHLTGCD